MFTRPLLRLITISTAFWVIATSQAAAHCDFAFSGSPVIQYKVVQKQAVEKRKVTVKPKRI
ncbi:hypothetical protein AJ87_15030 [Rhizobium yanglingense]|nr:hypothetical protein AJ87_15030 [Rhizobium yanglingense]